MQEKTHLFIYSTARPLTTVDVALPNKLRPADISGTAVLLDSVLKQPCYVGVKFSGKDSLWDMNVAPQNSDAKCAVGERLLSDDTVLVKEAETGPQVAKWSIVRRSGSIHSISAQGELIGATDTGRLVFQIFHPSALAEKLDMDFGGQKDITVYDLLRKTVLFHLTVGGQGSAALAPDGKHIAVIDGSNLLIYPIP